MTDELPPGWIVTRISDLTERIPNIQPEDWPEREFGYVDISAIDNSRFIVTDVRRLKGKDAPSRARRPIRRNDVLFSNVRTYLRNIALVPNCGADVCSTGFTVLRPNGAVEPNLLFRYVLTDAFIDAVTPRQTGTHYPATSDRVVISETMPLAPLNEQRRIVAKLEQLLVKVDACQQRLTKIPVLLKRFRQSVLAAACSGRLTADWRQKNRVDETNDDDVPPHWARITVGDVLESLKYGTATKCGYERRGVPVLRIPNVVSGRVDRTDLKFAELPAKELNQLRLIPGDLLLIRSNGSVSLVGRTAVVREAERDFAYAGYLIRLRPNRTKVEPDFLNLALSSFDVRLQIELEARSTSGVNNINTEEVRALQFSLPPLAEQKEIVRRVEALLALADQIEARYAKAKAHVDKLTQSILAKAFRGELVPQDPNDEPASVLLERIKQQ